MAYYLAAGVCGLGYFAYIKRKQLLYKGLLLYNRYTEKPQLNDDKILNIEGTENNENNNRKKIISRISMNEKYISILDDSIKNKDFYEKIFNENEVTNIILACTIKLDINDQNILDEFDVTEIFSSFLSQKLLINKENIYYILKYIIYALKLKINLKQQDKINCKWNILDKDVNLNTHNFFTVSKDEDNKIIIQENN